MSKAQTAQVASGWLMGLGASALFMTAPGIDLDGNKTGTALFLGQTIGLAGGFLMATKVNMSSKRIWVIDVSLLGGFAFGFGCAALFTESYTIRYFSGLAGLILAGAGSVIATKDMNPDIRGDITRNTGSLRIALPSMRFTL